MLYCFADRREKKVDAHEYAPATLSMHGRTQISRVLCIALFMQWIYAAPLSAVGLNGSDIYDPSNPPADLSRPSNAGSLVGKIVSPGGTIYGSAVVVAPEWVLTAKHVSAPAGPNRQVVIDGITYSVAERVAFPGSGTTGDGNDVALLRLTTLGGQAANLSYIGLANGNPVPGSHVTLGGFGQTFTAFDVDGYPDASQRPIGAPGTAGTLRWGRNTAYGYTPGADKDNFFLPTTSDDRINIRMEGTGDAGYIPYEAVPLNFDSGSGMFIRDGWEWKLSGINNTTRSAVDVSGKQAWIESVISNYQAPPATPYPYDTRFQRFVNGDWTNSANWDSGLPDSTSYAKIINAVDVTVGQDVTVGNLDVGWTTVTGSITQSGGSLAVVDTFSIGASAKGGFLSLQDGSFSAGRQYIGFNSSGTVWQTGGTNTADEFIVVGKSAGPTSTLFVSGGSVSSPSIVLGAESGSSGQVIVQGTGQVDANDVLVVGYEGSGTWAHSGGTLNVGRDFYIGLLSGSNGTFLQNGGTVNATNNSGFDVTLGRESGANGTYQLNAGTLLSHGVRVGLDGTGTFTQQGGTHTAGSVEVTHDVAGQANYAISNGQLNAQLIGVGVRGAYGDFTQSGGSVMTQDLWVRGSGVYSLSGGSLQVDHLAEVSGTVDFDNGSATLQVNGLFDSALGSVVNNTSAELQVGAHSLAVLPTGTASFAIEGGAGLVHRAGTPIDLANGYELKVDGNLYDRVRVLDTASINAPGNLSLQGGLDVMAGGSVDLGGGKLTLVSNETFAMNGGALSASDTEQWGEWVVSGATLTTSVFNRTTSRLIVDNTTIVGDLMHTGSIELGSGISDLTIDGNLGNSLSSQQQLKLDLGGVTWGQSDRLVVNGDVQFGGLLDVSIVSGFDPLPGMQVEVIRYSGSRSAGSEFQYFDHDGRFGLVLSDNYDDVNGNVTLTFDAWSVGDADLDGFIGQADMDAVLLNWGASGSSVSWLEGDFNGDQLVNQADLDAVLLNWGDTYAGNQLLPPDNIIGQSYLDRVLLNWGESGSGTNFLLGDFNSDQFVGQADLDYVLLNWGDNVPLGTLIGQAYLDAVLLNWGDTGSGVNWLTGDFDSDQFVSQADLDFVLLNWGMDTSIIAGSLATIPEPASIMVFALLGVMARRRNTSGMKTR